MNKVKWSTPTGLEALLVFMETKNRLIHCFPNFMSKPRETLVTMFTFAENDHEHTLSRFLLTSLEHTIPRSFY